MKKFLRRFEKLEKTGSETNAKKNCGQLKRFERLEVRDQKFTISIEERADKQKARSDIEAHFVRCECGADNLKDRSTCWYCGKKFSGGAETNVIAVTLGGKIYRSDQEDLPDDVRELFERIRREGYSPRLVENWLSDRKFEQQSGELQQRVLQTRVRENHQQIMAQVAIGIIMGVVGAVIIYIYWRYIHTVVSLTGG